MKGRHLDYDNQKQMIKLESFLEEQADSIQKIVKEATDVDIIRPIYYSAEYR